MRPKVRIMCLFRTWSRIQFPLHRSVKVHNTHTYVARSWTEKLRRGQVRSSGAVPKSQLKRNFVVKEITIRAQYGKGGQCWICWMELCMEGQLLSFVGKVQNFVRMHILWGKFWIIGMWWFRSSEANMYINSNIVARKFTHLDKKTITKKRELIPKQFCRNLASWIKEYYFHFMEV